MSKIRIYELAKELGVENKAIIALTGKLGIEGKTSHSNSLEPEEAELIRRAIIRETLGSDSAPGVVETIEHDKDGHVVTVRRKGNIIRRRRKEEPVAKEEALKKEGKESSQGHIVKPKEKATQPEMAEELQKAPVEEPVEEYVKDEPVGEGGVQEQVEVKKLDEPPQDALSVEAEPTEGRALEEPEEEVGKGPKILGKIKLKPAKVVPSKKAEPSAGDVVPIDSAKGKGKRKGRKERRSRRKEFSRGELVDYDGRAAKRQQKKRAAKGEKHEEGKEQPSAPSTVVAKASKRVVKIDEVITVGELAAAMSLKAGEVIAKLIELGQMVTINQAIDFDTASIIAEEFGFHAESVAFDEKAILEEGIDDDPARLRPRAPVVTVMGHVDHGKTSLLDAIRKTSVAQKEFGGITQHIGAYRCKIDDKNTITFIDTPGHEAFTAMRARGAQVTDIVILVVAADDGVMPQTREAIDHAKAADVPIIVAVNKIDKEGANPEVVKKQLAELGLQPEEWGGQTMFFNVSAIKGQGITELLEGVLLQAEVMELKADPERRAKGTVIESRQDRRKGLVATILVQSGTLRIGDPFVVGAESGRVRSMVDENGISLKEAGPSVPVEITGLNGIAEAGDDFYVVESDVKAKQVASVRAQKKQKKELLAAGGGPITLEEFAKRAAEENIAELNIIIKGDVQGSVEAVRSSVEKLVYEKVRVKVISSGVGGITEGDVKLAQASKAIIIGFNVRAEPRAARDADSLGVQIRYYNVIYDLVDDVKKALAGLLEPIKKESIIGHVEVRETFVIPKVGTIAGCYVTDGIVKRGAFVRILRDNKVVFDGKMSSLKRFKDDAREVQSGYECGIGLENYNDIKVGDIFEVYEIEEVAPTLK